MAVSATPFAACAYGMLYERTEIETTHQRIKLRRLPKAFDGFRIAQLSDIHIGPFMPADDIRKYVAMVNQLKPDLVALTGDFVTWEASPEGAVVEALSGLKAPFGIFGCLGNHERWAGRGRLHHPPLRRARDQDAAPCRTPRLNPPASA